MCVIAVVRQACQPLVAVLADGLEVPDHGADLQVWKEWCTTFRAQLLVVGVVLFPTFVLTFFSSAVSSNVITFSSFFLAIL